MDTPENVNPLGIRVPIPQMELHLKYEYCQIGDTLQGWVRVSAGLQPLTIHSLDISLVRQELQEVGSEGQQWISTEYWPFRKWKYCHLGPQEFESLEFEFKTPEDALPDCKDYRHFLSVVLVTEEQVRLEATTEVLIHEMLENYDEDKTSMHATTGAGRSRKYPTMGDKLFRPHALGDYLQRFEEMVQALRRCSVAIVLDFHTFPPLSADEISSYEARMGLRLSDALREFYLQTNGLQLRWIRKDNPRYDPSRDHPRTQPLDWRRLDDASGHEDGRVMILPLEHLLDDGGRAEAAATPPKHPKYAVHWLDQQLASVDFQRGARILDWFSSEQQAILVLTNNAQPLIYFGKLGQVNPALSNLVDTGTYLEFLIARLGLVTYRSEFLLTEPSKVSPYFYGGKAYWEWQAIEPVTMDLAGMFPLCTTLPRACEFNKDWIREKNASLSDKVIAIRMKQLKAHKQWLDEGGRVLDWIRFMAGGIPWILTITSDERGGNMVQSLGRLDGCSWRGANLPYLGCAAMEARGMDAAAADLRFGLFIHTDFEGANFAGANLRGVDFTGCNLRNANFQGADIAGADFEIADLRGADFTGANISHARFPGARLEGVLRHSPHPQALPVPSRTEAAVTLLLLNDRGLNYLTVESSQPRHTLLPDLEETNLGAFLECLTFDVLLNGLPELKYWDAKKLVESAKPGERLEIGRFIVLVGDYHALRPNATLEQVEGVSAYVVRMD